MITLAVIPHVRSYAAINLEVQSESTIAPTMVTWVGDKHAPFVIKAGDTLMVKFQKRNKRIVIELRPAKVRP